MIVLTVAYILLVVSVTIPLVFMLKTRLWSDYFLFFLSLSAFALLNVYGLYALVHSVAFKSPNFVNFLRVFIAFLLVIISFYIMFPIYQALGPSRLALKWSKDVSDTRDRQSGTVTVCLLWCFCAALIAYYFITTGTRPLLLDLVEGRLAGLSHMELEIERWKRGWLEFHWFAPAFYQIPTFLVLYTYALTHFFPSRIHSLLFWVSLGITTILSITFLSKGVIVFLFIGIAIAAILLQSRIRTRAFLVVIVGLAVAFWLYTVFFAISNESLIELGKLMWHRIIETYSMAAGIILSLFPEHLSFFNGITINNPGGLLPYEHVDLSFIIYKYLYGIPHGGATFAAVWEGYANFGYLGLVTFILVVQFLVFALHLIFRLTRKSAFTFALFVYLSLQVLNLWMNSLFYTIVSPPFLLTIIVIMSIRYVVTTFLVGRRSRLDIRRIYSSWGEMP